MFCRHCVAAPFSRLSMVTQMTTLLPLECTAKPPISCNVAKLARCYHDGINSASRSLTYHTVLAGYHLHYGRLPRNLHKFLSSIPLLEQVPYVPRRHLLRQRQRDRMMDPLEP